jgi:hypothetical protein
MDQFLCLREEGEYADYVEVTKPKDIQLGVLDMTSFHLYSMECRVRFSFRFRLYHFVPLEKHRISRRRISGKLGCPRYEKEERALSVCVSVWSCVAMLSLPSFVTTMIILPLARSTLSIEYQGEFHGSFLTS